MTRGRPCDYSGLSYAKLSASEGIRWPCNDQFPQGAPRLYTTFRFNTGYDECETWGHDLKTGAAIPPDKYRADDPAGRAILSDAEYTPPQEEPDDQYPLWLTTGRIVYHFHTRTKTGRSPELTATAPDAFIQMHGDDARKTGSPTATWSWSSRVAARSSSRPGSATSAEGRSTTSSGHTFVPFHFGYWDEPGRPRPPTS